MPRKSSMDLPSYTKQMHRESWYCVGIDTSMTSVAVFGIGYDPVQDQMCEPLWAETRWLPVDDYFTRLGQAAKAHEMVLDVTHGLWVIDTKRVYIALEEPFYFGAVKAGQSSYLKQQAEIAGAVKGALVRYGYTNLYEINNSQWHKTLRDEGVAFQSAPKNATQAEKTKIKMANKSLVKEWAINAFGLPDLPDLVKSKSGAKILRPESGFGAKAKAEQPHDAYDAAAVAAWMIDNRPE